MLTSSRHALARSRSAGFTLLELLIIAAVICLIAAIGFPMYQSAIDTARLQKTIVGVRTISYDVDIHYLMNGAYPASLADVNHAHHLDGWGRPYQYLDLTPFLAGGNGNGQGNGGGGGQGNAGGNGNGNGNGSGGSNSSGGDQEDTGSSGNGNGGENGGGNGNGGQSGGGDGTGGENGGGNGNGGENGDGNGNGNGNGGENGGGPPDQPRKDKSLHPINSDYDLFSVGKDGTYVAPLTAKPSWDDVIRANNGAFIGLAKNY